PSSAPPVRPPLEKPAPLMPSPPPASLRWRLAALCEQALLHARALHLGRLFRADCGAAVLMYHSVPGSEQRPWIDPQNAIPEELFARQMRFLAAERHVLSLAELVDSIESGRSPRAGSVVLTFDDGYLDNYTVAAPILASLGLPATFFLVTGYVDDTAPQWVDELYSLYRTRTAHELLLRARRLLAFDLTDQAHVEASHGWLSSWLLAAEVGERRRLLDDLRLQLRPAAVPPRLTLSWEEVRALLAMHPGFEVGVHT